MLVEVEKYLLVALLIEPALHLSCELVVAARMADEDRCHPCSPTLDPVLINLRVCPNGSADGRARYYTTRKSVWLGVEVEVRVFPTLCLEWRCSKQEKPVHKSKRELKRFCVCSSLFI